MTSFYLPFIWFYIKVAYPSSNEFPKEFALDHKDPKFYDSEEAFEKARLLHNIDLTRRQDYSSKLGPLERAMTVAKIVLEPLLSKQETIEALCPGHGIGHLLHDAVCTIDLNRTLETQDPTDRFVGFTAGLLHDIGIIFVGRYNESQRYVRHGEAAAIYVMTELAPHIGSLLTEDELGLIGYAIAAHTHYRTETVKGPNGEDIEIQPYRDTYEDGTPIWFVWFCRWIDRLDVNGVHFIARHLLTLGDKHEDFDGTAFHDTEFATAAFIELRTWDNSRGTDANGNRLVPTALEHFRMFLLSQDNRSADGKYDLPGMQELRDRQVMRLGRALLAATDGRTVQNTGFPEEAQWKMARQWLYQCEPSEAGLKAATTIIEMFKRLDDHSRACWLALFEEASYQHGLWCKEKTEMLRKLGADSTVFLGHTLKDFLDF